MKIFIRRTNDGIALIIVMIAILVLAALAGGFAYSMKVETKLARNAYYEIELEWMGRSGVELARYIVAQQLNIASEPYDSLNQKWAGGPGGMGSTNSVLMDIPMENIPLGNGKFSIKITDLERKINVNMVKDYQGVFEQALAKLGFEEAPSIVGCITDWIDRDDLISVNGGAENDYYHGLNPPYDAKNGPIDDLSELLLIKGITPEMYWGTASTNYTPAAFQAQNNPFRRKQSAGYPVGLVDIFTPISVGKVNINTASSTVLGLIVEENIASEIIRLRSGPDGADGTEDDTPLHNPGELVNVGISRQVVQSLLRIFDVRSRTFEVEVDAEINNYKRTFVAIIGRNNQRDVQVLNFYWK